MEKIEKRVYKVPVVTIIEVRQEGVVCISGTREGYGDAIQEEWE